MTSIVGLLCEFEYLPGKSVTFINRVIINTPDTPGSGNTKKPTSAFSAQASFLVSVFRKDDLFG